MSIITVGQRKLMGVLVMALLFNACGKQTSNARQIEGNNTTTRGLHDFKGEKVLLRNAYVYKKEKAEVHSKLDGTTFKDRWIHARNAKVYKGNKLVKILKDVAINICLSKVCQDPHQRTEVRDGISKGERVRARGELAEDSTGFYLFATRIAEDN